MKYLNQEIDIERLVELSERLESMLRLWIAGYERGSEIATEVRESVCEIRICHETDLDEGLDAIAEYEQLLASRSGVALRAAEGIGGWCSTSAHLVALQFVDAVDRNNDPRLTIAAARSIHAMLRLERLQVLDAINRADREFPPLEVSLKDVVALVGRHLDTVRSCANHWPAPFEAARGSKPARWKYADIYPKLSEQFPHATLIPPTHCVGCV